MAPQEPREPGTGPASPSDDEPNQEPPRTGPGRTSVDRWRTPVRFASGRHGGAYAYRPFEVIVDIEAVGALQSITPRKVEVHPLPGGLALVRGVTEVSGALRASRARGFRSQPNHVMFSTMGRSLRIRC